MGFVVLVCSKIKDIAGLKSKACGFDSLEVQTFFFQILLSSIYFMGEDTSYLLFPSHRVPFAEICQFAVWSSSSVGFSIYFLISHFANSVRIYVLLSCLGGEPPRTSIDTIR